MDSHTIKLSAEEIAVFRTSAQRRFREQQDEIIRRKESAWKIARHAAEVLRERFNVERVVVFGSLVHKECFTPWSDVDLAAWGLSPEDTLRAIGAMMDLDETLEVNLVDVQTCRPSMLAVIEEEGIEL